MFIANDVPFATRQTWCVDQTNTCINICLDSGGYQPDVSYCSPDTLEYDCVCKNGLRPNSTGNYFTITKRTRELVHERVND